MESKLILRKADLMSILMNRHINLAISKSCFTSCIGCYNEFNEREELIDIDSIRNFLSFVNYHNISNKVTLSGGDPLSRPDIIEIINVIIGLNFRLNLDTVGTPLLGDTFTIHKGIHQIKRINPEDLKGVDLLGIPIDGSENKVAQGFRFYGKDRSKDYIRDTLTILEICQAHNLPVCINTVVHQRNKEDISNIFELIYHFTNIRKWQLFQYMPYGPGSRYRQIYEIDEVQFKAVVHNLKSYIAHFSLIYGQRNYIEIEPKSIKDRENLYFMVDSLGNMWLPKEGADPPPILGNIKSIKLDDSVFK